MGALCGSASSFVNRGTGSLTGGYTSARAASLATALQGSNPLLADYLGTTTQFDPILPAQPLPVQPTGVAGELGSTSLALSSVESVGVGQVIGGASLAGGTYVTKVIAAGSTAVAGTIAAGLTALPTTNASGLSIGQIVTGTGIAADTVITAITGNNLTLSKPLAGVATGAVTGLAMLYRAADCIEQVEREKAVVSDLWEQQKEIALDYLTDCNKAADCIEAQAAEIERLRAVLRRTLTMAELYAEGTGTNFNEAMAEARAALQEKSK